MERRRTMKRRLRALCAALAASLLLTGCSSVLSGEIRIVTPYVTPTSQGPGRIKEVETYEELKSAAVDFILNMEEKGMVRVFSYDGDIENDVISVCNDIPENHPIGAFALSGMEGAATKIVSYYEVEFSFIYNTRITPEYLNGIVTVSTLRYFKAGLLTKLTSYSGFSAMLTNNLTLSAEDALKYVEETYYEHPLDIVMAPVAAVEIFPDHGTSRLFFFTFGYRYEPSTLKVMDDSLKSAVSSMVESVSATNRAAALLTLCRRLVEFVKYDSDTAAGEYNNQHISATAYGALVTGTAVGEGYAMAYKALCDRLGITCFVVLGNLGDMEHAWNIVEIGGDYYHIDPAMCAVHGIPGGFLKNDADMMDAGYTWDTGRYMTCDGTLTYEDVLRG
jgi:hypothetical protein